MMMKVSALKGKVIDRVEVYSDVVLFALEDGDIFDVRVIQGELRLEVRSRSPFPGVRPSCSVYRSDSAHPRFSVSLALIGVATITFNVVVNAAEIASSPVGTWRIPDYSLANRWNKASPFMTGPLCTSGDLESDSRRHVNPQSAIQPFRQML